MLFRGLFFLLLLLDQSSCFSPQNKCYDLTFGKCSTMTYCGKTDTGVRACLPCPSGKLCPGDGYMYLAPQANNLKLNHNSAKYITNVKNNSYIVSSNRILIRKKLKKIGKIVKVGLTIAAIAKTGGTAALKKAAAAKAKEFAIKKGIQCLKNGLSNFCKGKKKGRKIGLISKGVKVKPRIGGIVKAPKVTKPRVSNKKTITPRARNPNLSRPKISNPKTRTSKAKAKPREKPAPTTKTSKTFGKTKRRVKRQVTKPQPQPCRNIFDSLANKVNNATSHVADKVVNKGRDWLKKNVGGNSGNCEKRTPAKRPTNLRGSKSKPTPISSGSSTDDSTYTPSSDDTPSNTRSTDDSTPSPKAKPKTQPKKQVIKPPPISRTDDNIASSKPVRIKKKPISKTDDVVIVAPTSRPINRRRQPIARTDDAILTVRPSRQSRVKTSKIPVRTKSTKRPIAIRVTATPIIRPSRVPNARPTRIPTVALTIGPIVRPTRMPITRRPTVIPTVSPTRNPTARPSPAPTRIPTPQPSVRPTLTPSAVAGPPTMLPYSGVSWAAFSSAPVIVRPSAFPSRVPTISMFNMLTNIPTRAPKSLRVSVGSPTLAPSKLIPTQLPSAQPTLTPSAVPSIQPSIQPSFQPSIQSSFQPSLTPTNNPTSAIGASSINSASSGQTVTSPTVIGVGIGCIILVIIIVIACVIFTRKSNGKMTPYEIWSSHYSKKNQQPHIQSPSTDTNEDIHHFYTKNNNYIPSPRPSFNQNTVFTPHVSGRTSFRNSQIVTHVGPQKNYNSKRLSIIAGSSFPNYPL